MHEKRLLDLRIKYLPVEKLNHKNRTKGLPNKINLYCA